ncbi:hypothetical protein P280DRAFT_457612 [Massarina eburnea CBS 473.64]|uniref:MARVEL domain-containing protein n=1 Tax=Massarina eburnea CBS 473.64 TaxID=1395130 RepID=A0A6A6RU18_9PLEO|nr:hypothetical protein P280DRAFT_457612 [Massarina eburnea CBS 473.64]
MRINTSYVQKCKTVAHVFQVLFIFVGGCIALAVFTKDGDVGGATRYFFALCFCTMPAILYLTMVPMWSRAVRFANAYAFVAVDAIYTILWFGAFISVAMWNSAGVKQGAIEQKQETSNCTTFKYGNEEKCKLSRATVGMGIVVFLLFALTAAISGYYLHAYRKEGTMPYESMKPNPHHESGETGKDAIWSTEIDGPHHRSDSLDEDRHTEHGGNQQEDEYALLHGTETEDGRHPGRPLSWGEDRHGRYAAYADDVPPNAPSALSPSPASALTHGGYEEYRREAAGGIMQTAAAGPHGFGGKGYTFGDGNPR